MTDQTDKSVDEAGIEETPSDDSRWLTVVGVIGAVASIAGVGVFAWRLRNLELPFFAILGLALGIICAVVLREPSRRANGRKLVRRASHAASDLGIALFPLPLFALVVVFFAAGGFAVWLQLLIGFAFVPYWFAMRRLEGGAAKGAGERAGRVIARVAPWFGFAVTVGLVVLAIVALVLIRFAWGVVDRFIEYGGWLTLFAALAVAIWLLAAVLRLVWFASTVWRALAVLSLFFPIYHGAALLGVLPGYNTMRHVPNRVDVWIVLAAAAVLVADAFLPRLAPRITRHAASWRSLMRELGLLACIAASLLFAGTVVYGKVRPLFGSQGYYDEFGDYYPGYSSTPPSSLDDLTLARTYAPLLDFDEKEQFFPEDVEAYLNDAKLLPRNGEEVPPPPLTPNSLPRKCDHGGDRCFVLTCRAGEGRCANPKHLPNAKYLDGTQYARIVHRDEAPKVFDVKTPFGDDLTTLVQYWLFYRYNKWQSPTVAGGLTQQHEADWEAVTIGFSPSKPLFVAYSAHCGGHWLRWKKIEAAPLFWVNGRWVPRTSASGPSLHPVIAVARGSHANYVRTWHGRPPDWGSCGANIPRATTASLSYTWNLREHTGDGIEFLPRRIALVDELRPPMSFPGYWGLSDRVTLRNFRYAALPIGTPSDGPLSPPLQPLWINPLERIFHGSHWREGE